MIEIFEDEKEYILRQEYFKNKLFCTLFPGLNELRTIYDGELSPTQIWHETEVFCAQRLRGSSSMELEVMDLYNTLISRYSLFVDSNGSYQHRSVYQAEYTAVCVLTCVNFRLIAEPDNPYDCDTSKAIEEILKLIGSHPLHYHLYHAQRKREQQLEDEGKEIELQPWVSQPPSDAKNESAESIMEQIFQKLFNKNVSYQHWVDLVNKCEEEIPFDSKNQRIAYLVMASQKFWLKESNSVNISSWVRMMNGILGADKKMQQADISKKWNEMRTQCFYRSYTAMYEQLNFKSENITEKFYDKLRQNVISICAIERDYC